MDCQFSILIHFLQKHVLFFAMEMEYICGVPANVRQDGKDVNVKPEKWNVRFRIVMAMEYVKEGNANVRQDSRGWTVVWVRFFPFLKTLCWSKYMLCVYMFVN